MLKNWRESRVVGVLEHVSCERAGGSSTGLACEEKVQGDLMGAYSCWEGSYRIVG